jgi:hypothetical protein
MGTCCAAVCSAEAQGFGMRRSAEAQSFLDPLLRAAACGFNGERCSAALQRQQKKPRSCCFSLSKLFEYILSQAF